MNNFFLSFYQRIVKIIIPSHSIGKKYSSPIDFITNLLNNTLKSRKSRKKIKNPYGESCFFCGRNYLIANKAEIFAIEQ